MNTFVLYFVGYVKDGYIQSLVSGAFVTRADAEEALASMVASGADSDRYVVCASRIRNPVLPMDKFEDY